MDKKTWEECVNIVNIGLLAVESMDGVLNCMGILLLLLFSKAVRWFGYLFLGQV